MNNTNLLNIRSVNVQLYINIENIRSYTARDLYYNNNVMYFFNNKKVGSLEGEEIIYEISKEKFTELKLIKSLTYNDIVL